MKIFCTDLDNTLIYSYKREIGEEKRGVEVYRGREVSFMTEKAFQLLRRVSEKAMIVPVTTRNVEQYQRIKLGIGIKYALTCNGGVLLEDGQKDMGWYYDSLKLTERSWEELLKARELLKCEKDRSMEVQFIEELFVFTKSKEPERTIHTLREKLDLSKIDVFQNGVKIYAVPKILTKGNAVRRLREKLKAEYVIAAGDNEFDISMLEEADTAVIPELLVQKWQSGQKQEEKKCLSKGFEEKQPKEKCSEEERPEGKHSKGKHMIIGKEKIYSDELLKYVFDKVK